MSDTLNEIVLKRNFTELRYYNTQILLSGLKLGLLRIKYIGERIKEEKEKAELLNRIDKENIQRLDLYVYMPPHRSAFNNTPIDIIDVINFNPPRVKWKIDSLKARNNFISNCIWSLGVWENAKNWFKEHQNYYENLAVKLNIELKLLEKMILEFPYKMSNNQNGISTESIEIKEVQNQTSQLFETNNEHIDNITESPESIKTVPISPEIIDTKRKLSDLNTLDEKLPNDVKGLVDYISQLFQAKVKNKKKLIVDRVWELYNKNYKSVPLFANKSNYLRIIFPFINRPELKWNIDQFLSYALSY
jgi:hypothetical protein